MQRSINSVKYLDASELHRMLLNKKPETPFKVVDVRGSDYLGGHIKGSLHFPYSQLKHDDEYLQELKQALLSDRQAQSASTPVKCIFHCAMSQQRGPSAALLFLRALTEEEFNSGLFEVYILKGGFIHWVSAGYGRDPKVTEDYLDYLWQ